MQPSRRFQYSMTQYQLESEDDIIHAQLPAAVYYFAVILKPCAHLYRALFTPFYLLVSASYATFFQPTRRE